MQRLFWKLTTKPFLWAYIAILAAALLITNVEPRPAMSISVPPEDWRIDTFRRVASELDAMNYDADAFKLYAIAKHLEDTCD